MSETLWRKLPRPRALLLTHNHSSKGKGDCREQSPDRPSGVETRPRHSGCVDPAGDFAVVASWVGQGNKRAVSLRLFFLPFYTVHGVLMARIPEWFAKEKRVTEDEMVGWHHQVSGHELEQTPGDSERQESLACCSPRGLKESETTW